MRVLLIHVTHVCALHSGAFSNLVICVCLWLSSSRPLPEAGFALGRSPSTFSNQCSSWACRAHSESTKVVIFIAVPNLWQLVIFFDVSCLPESRHLRGLIFLACISVLLGASCSHVLVLVPFSKSP